MKLQNWNEKSIEKNKLDSNVMIETVVLYNDINFRRYCLAFRLNLKAKYEKQFTYNLAFMYNEHTKLCKKIDYNTVSDTFIDR